jgi:hypothetical protein
MQLDRPFVEAPEREDVGARDFRFGVTGMLLIAGIAILLTIIS